MAEELPSRLREPRDYFFGCRGHRGHEFRRADNTPLNKNECGARGVPIGSPFGLEVDGGILKAKNVPDRPGEGVLVTKEGWGYLAFWDRTGDNRPNSNSGFLFNRAYEKDIAIRRAHRLFPWVFDGIGFELNIR